jgi:DNA-binding NarL/FixJ family response regulator
VYLGLASRANHSILLADQDEQSRASIFALTSSLGLSPETVDTGAQLLAEAHRSLPALVLFAVDVVDPSGYEVLHQLRDRFGERLPIAVLSAINSEPRDEIAALLLGADDYFTKPLQPDRFIARVRRLLTHAPAPPPRNPRAPASAPRALTMREQQVLTMLVDGHRSAEIAESLCITKKTAGTHIEHILTKLGAHSQAQAVAFAVRNQILNHRG